MFTEIVRMASLEFSGVFNNAACRAATRLNLKVRWTINNDHFIEFISHFLMSVQ